MRRRTEMSWTICACAEIKLPLYFTLSVLIVWLTVQSNDKNSSNQKKTHSNHPFSCIGIKANTQLNTRTEY